MYIFLYYIAFVGRNESDLTGVVTFASSTTFRIRKLRFPIQQGLGGQGRSIHGPLGAGRGGAGLPSFEFTHCCFSSVLSEENYWQIESALRQGGSLSLRSFLNRTRFHGHLICMITDSIREP